MIATIPRTFPASLLLLLLTHTVAAQATWLQTPEIASRNRSTSVWDSWRARVVNFGPIGPGGPTLGETLEWDGLGWVKRTSDHLPGALASATMAFDAARGETVLYGGGIGNQTTWVWDGHDWQQRVTATLPPDLYSHTMSNDPVRQRVVMFGGRLSPFPTYSAQTWEWDGVDWILRAPATSPSARSDHTTAWDPISQRTLLYGGSSLSNPATGDTWAWDGSNWSQLSPANSPPSTTGRMVTDPIGNRVLLLVLSATLSVDAWEWTGSNWVQIPLTSPANPPVTSSFVFDGHSGGVIAAFGSGSAASTWSLQATGWSLLDLQPNVNVFELASDPARGRVVMFREAASTGPTSPTRTFEWNGNRWLPRVTNLEPPQSLNAVGFAHDRLRGETVLFGGVDSSNTYWNETWTWDGTAWAQRQPAMSPSARTAGGMVYDTWRGVCVLYGGVRTAPLVRYYDTWEWDGLHWVERTPATVPMLDNVTMVFDESRGRTVMVSTFSAFETWEWDGNDWSQILTANAPPVNRLPMAYDPVRQHVVGVTNIGPGQTWIYDGADWSFNNTPTPAPFSSLAWDSVRKRVLLRHVGVNQTWLYGPNVPAEAISYGGGCPGSNGIPALDARGLPSMANSTFKLELSSARANAIALVQISPLPATIPVGSCTLLTGSPSILLVPPMTNAGGFSELPIPLPVLPQLLGTAWYAQGIVFDPAGAAFGTVAATAGLRLVLGD